MSKPLNSLRRLLKFPNPTHTQVLNSKVEFLELNLSTTMDESSSWGRQANFTNRDVIPDSQSEGEPDASGNVIPDSQGEGESDASDNEDKGSEVVSPLIYSKW